MSNTFKCPQKPSFKIPTDPEPKAVPEVVPVNTNPAVPPPDEDEDHAPVMKKSRRRSPRMPPSILWYIPIDMLSSP